MFSSRSDWPLKLGMVSAVHLPTFLFISHASFPAFLRKKELFGTGSPLVWYVLKQLFTEVEVNSGRCDSYLAGSRGPFLETPDNTPGPKTILGAQYSPIATQFLLILKAKF